MQNDSEPQGSSRQWPWWILIFSLLVGVGIVFLVVYMRNDEQCVPPYWIDVFGPTVCVSGTPTPSPAPSLTYPTLPEVLYNSPPLIAVLNPNGRLTKVCPYKTSVRLRAEHEDKSITVTVTDEDQNYRSQEWRLGPVAQLGLPHGSWDHEVEVGVYYKQQFYRALGSAKPNFTLQGTSTTDPVSLSLFALPDSENPEFYYAFFAGRNPKENVGLLHIVEDNLVWRYAVQDTYGFGKYLLHYKPTPSDLEPKYLSTILSTFQEAAEFLRSADFEPLPRDAEGGATSYDVYVVAADEQLGVHGAESQEEYLPGTYGYVATARSIDDTPANQYDAHSYMVIEAGTPLAQSVLRDAADARLTVVHELFHGVQFAKSTDVDGWFAEGCASSLEVLFELYFQAKRPPEYERVLLEYVPAFLNQSWLGLDSLEPGLAYGTCVFVLFCLQSRPPITARVALHRVWSNVRRVAEYNTLYNKSVYPATHALRMFVDGTEEVETPNLTTLGALLCRFQSANATQILRARGGVTSDPANQWGTELASVQTFLAQWLVPTPTTLNQSVQLVTAELLEDQEQLTHKLQHPVNDSELAPGGSCLLFGRHVPSGEVVVPAPPENWLYVAFVRQASDDVVKQYTVTNDQFIQDVKEVVLVVVRDVL